MKKKIIILGLAVAIMACLPFGASAAEVVNFPEGLAQFESLIEFFLRLAERISAFFRLFPFLLY